MKIHRRRFLGFTAGAAAGAALGVPIGRAFSDLVADRSIRPERGPEDASLSVCRLCPGGCGIRVRRIGGRPVKLDGNPLHPVSAGRLCPKGQAALQSLYHPDRVTTPLRRVGERGSVTSFEPTSWEEALTAISGRLAELREGGRPESLVLVRGASRGLAGRLADRFLHAFGSPNDIRCDHGETAAALALSLTQGVMSGPAFDLEATDYVLSFGGALLEAWGSPVHTMQAYGRFRQGRPGRRGKFVHADSRMSITASSADEWIPIRPGSEGVLALGICRVLVSEGLYDQDFVLRRTRGFEDYRDEGGKLHDGLRTLLERELPLDRVTAATGVSVNVILRLAREFAAARRQLAVGPRRGPLLPGTLLAHLACHTLNALVGEVDAPGGVLVPEPVPLAPWPELPRDPVADAGRRRPRLDGGAGPHPLSDPEALAEAMIEGSPYPAEMLVVLEGDPAFTTTAPDRFAAAIEKVPTVVSFATIPDDTAWLANWILPATHFLESWDLDTTPPGIPYPVVSLAQPAVEPAGECRPAAEVFLELAGRLGGEVAAAFPWPGLPELMRVQMDGLYQARRGAILGTDFDEAWVRMMERAGWWAPGYRTADELWDRALATGGWWDPFYDHGDWQRVLATPSQRFELRPDLLHLEMGRGATDETAERTEDGVPSLALVLFEPLPVSGGIGAELPFLQELLDPGLDERWETWVEVHPETAERLGIHDRHWVEVRSQRASVEARARVTPRVVRDTVALPVGLGKKAGGRWAAGRGTNPLRLLVPAREPVSGLPDLGSTRVQIVPVSASRRRQLEERS